MITIPTMATIKGQIVTDIESKIGQTIPALPRAFFRVFAAALAAVIYLLYRSAAWVYGQIFPQTADLEALVRIGGQYGIIRTPATAAQLTATATGTPAEIIPAGTLWQNSGIVYEQPIAAQLDAYGEITIAVEALIPGSNGNLVNGSIIELVTPIAGIDTEATIAGTTLEADDAEDIESFRQRIIFRLANRPQGGAAPDYITWAREVAGIVKAFAFRTDPGVVTVYPLVSLTVDRIPTYEKLVEVEAYLNDTIRRPLCATVYAAEMTERTFDIIVTSIIPDDVTMKANIEEAWANYLLSRYPVQYTGEATQADYIALAGLYKEASAVGANVIEFELYIDGTMTPITYHLLQQNEIAILGTVTWPT